jgi:hypothetical protein
MQLRRKQGHKEGVLYVVRIERGRALFIEVRNMISSASKVLKTTIPTPTTKMYVCIRGGLLQPLHLDPQWSIVLNY